MPSLLTPHGSRLRCFRHFALTVNFGDVRRSGVISAVFGLLFIRHSGRSAHAACWLGAVLLQFEVATILSARSPQSGHPLEDTCMYSNCGTKANKEIWQSTIQCEAFNFPTPDLPMAGRGSERGTRM